MPGQSDVGEPNVLERLAVSGQAELDLLPRERPSSWPPWGCLTFAIKVEHSTVRRGSLDPIALQGIFVGWNRKVPHGIKNATFRDDGEVEEVFTSTTVRTRDTVLPLFGDAGTKSATEAELQESGESERVRADEAEGPSLALRRPDVEPEKADGNLAPGEAMQDDRDPEQPDPEELRRRVAEVSADAAGARPTMMGSTEPASAEPRRRITVKKTSASSRETRGMTERRRR